MDEPPGYTVLLVAFSGGALALALGIAGLLLLVAAFVSLAEVAFFSIKNLSLEQLRQSQRPDEHRVVELLQKPKLLLATTRIATNLAITTLCVITSLIILNTESAWSLLAIGAVVISFVFVLLCEIVPRTFASFNFLAVAVYLARPVRLLVMLFKPVTTPWLKINSLIERRFESKGQRDTVAELNQALEMAAVDRGATEDEKEILRGIVNFGTLTVKQVMRTRSRVSAVDTSLNFHQLMEYVSETGYSRIPVFRKSLDRIEGILHIKDLLPFMDDAADFEWQTLLRPGFFVPGAKKLDSLLKDFQEKHVHMAIVVNEYGGTLGLVTLEDVIEEIIGEINDEFDEASVNYQKVDEKTYVFEGRTTLHDFCKLLSLDPAVFDGVRGSSKTLGGLILELNRELPKTGSQISYEQFTFGIEAADRRKIKRVRISIHDREEV